jgi:hypothetical protein
MSYGIAELSYFQGHCEPDEGGRGKPIHPSTALSQGHWKPDAVGRNNPNLSHPPDQISNAYRMPQALSIGKKKSTTFASI